MPPLFCPYILPRAPGGEPRSSLRLVAIPKYETLTPYGLDPCSQMRGVATPQSFDDGDLLGANSAEFHFAFGYLDGLREKDGILIIAAQCAANATLRPTVPAGGGAPPARAAGRCGWHSTCQPPYAGRSCCGYCGLFASILRFDVWLAVLISP